MKGFRLLNAAALATALFAGSAAHTDEPPVVFAAASLKNALDEAAMQFEQKTGTPVLINYAGSAALARQIEEAAPADIYISADLDWMDYLEARNLIREESRSPLLGNAIVLIAPAESDAALDIESDMDLTGPLGADGRLAMANVETVPAGRYAKASLQHLGAWDAVADRLVQTDNVRTALAFVSSGEAPLGIVYATDATAEPAVRIVDTFEDDTHPPIRYPVALTVGSNNSTASAFLDFVRSDAARPAFERQGFTFLPSGTQP